MTYLKSMFWTGASAFVFVFVPTATGWLTSVQQGNPTDPSVLRSAGISALAAAGVAVVNAGTVLLRKQSWFPAEPPVYGPEG